MAEYDPDRFDDVPASFGRVGAHRAPRRPGRGWIAVAWALLASGALVVAGLYSLSLVSDSVTFEIPGFTEPEATPTPEPTPTATPTAEPVLDPTTVELPSGFTITILNATPVAGLAAQGGTELSDAGWPVGTTTNAAQDDIPETVVYYSDPANEGLARGIAQLLGVADIELSDAFPGAAVTVVLGADYAERG
ncbi:MAG: LytR C-terminal domain-containing protein [Microcella sp.]|uniref:LytR C-terminal domain-containing protein n=1 Tax=Microcella sp. TaxID=1913979 RepID=UPI0033146664